MATARAIANGNWSSTSTWNGGVLPGNGDTVYANGFLVTINQDINIGGANNPTVNAGSFVSGQWYEVLFVGTTSWTAIGAASNTAGVIFLATGAGTGTGNARALATLTTAANTPAGATGGGGSFAMSSTFAITTDLRAGTTTCLSVTGATALTLDGLRVIGGSAASAHGCNYSGTTTCTLANGTFTGGSGTANALNNASTGTVNVSASCTFTGGSGGNAQALNNASSGTVIVTQGTFTASAFTNAVSSASTSADVRLSGDFLDHWSGFKAVSSPRFRLGTAPTLGQTRYALAGTTDSYFTMFGSDFGTFGNPIAANVRTGIVYGGGNLTGTCAVPAAGSVALGVPVDATTGTAVLTPAAVWGHATRTITGGLVDTATTLTNAPTVPSVVQIRQELDSNSTKLANLDATVSSRLAPSGTLATVTNLTNAPASVTPSDIWSHATRTLTSASGPTATEIRQEMDSNSTKLANLDATVSSRLAPSGTLATVTTLTNAPTVPSAAAIASQVRTELSTELARVDAAISSRLAGSAYTAPANSDISAIKAKTDNLPTAPAAVSNIPTAAQNASATRSELSVELSRVDQAISTRATPANIPTADIAAIKAKTDAVNVDRINNTATLSQVGNLLAQANS